MSDKIYYFFFYRNPFIPLWACLLVGFFFKLHVQHISVHVWRKSFISIFCFYLFLLLIYPKGNKTRNAGKTYSTVSFSQKLLLFLIRSTEVERVRDRECSRISLSLAFWTRFSAVFGHYHYFFKQSSLILRCRTSLKRLPTAFSRPEASYPSSYISPQVYYISSMVRIFLTLLRKR